MAPGHVFPAVNPKLYICVILSGLLASRMRILDGFVRIDVVVPGIVGYVAIYLPFLFFGVISPAIPFVFCIFTLKDIPCVRRGYLAER